jgi:hypothetical protein
MTIDEYLTLLSEVPDCDVPTLHTAFWHDDTDALAIIAIRYGEAVASSRVRAGCHDIASTPRLSQTSAQADNSRV